MSNHAAEQWHLSDIEDCNEVIDEQGRTIAEVTEWAGSEPRGYATMISAAPELLESLLAIFRHPHIQAYLPYAPDDETFLNAAAAVRKARGIS